MLDCEADVDWYLSLIQQCCPGALRPVCNSNHPVEICSRRLAQGHSTLLMRKKQIRIGVCEEN